MDKIENWIRLKSWTKSRIENKLKIGKKNLKKNQQRKNENQTGIENWKKKFDQTEKRKIENWTKLRFGQN